MDLTQLFFAFLLYLYALSNSDVGSPGPAPPAGCPLCLRGAVRTCAGHAADNDVHVGLTPSSACARSCSSRSRTFRAARAERGRAAARPACAVQCRRAEKASLEAHARAAPAATPAYAGASDASHRSQRRRATRCARRAPPAAAAPSSSSRVSVSTRIAVCRSPLPARSTAAGRVFAPLATLCARGALSFVGRYLRNCAQTAAVFTGSRHGGLYTC
jgi:hypothetical protein